MVLPAVLPDSSTSLQSTGGGRREAGRRDTQGVGPIKIGDKFRDIRQFFAIEEHKEAGTTKEGLGGRGGGGGAGRTRYGKREIQSCCSLSR